MRIRTRLVLAFLLVSGVGFYQFTYWVLEDLRPRYLATMEEAMVDTAVALASLVEAQQSVDGLRAAFDGAGRKTFSAVIYEMEKAKINMRVYVTDAQGIVIFDSDHGKDEGQDYSRWNDVHRTLRGEYGARASRSDPEDPMTALLCVAAPIRRGGNIEGVLAVCKHTDSIAVFLATARREIVYTSVFTAVTVGLLGILASLWLTQPIERLTRFARAVRDGKRAALPRLGSGEIAALGAAFEEMREALEGKKYVEHYVQALTHQMKSPLSAIRGAAELLGEEMPAEERARFLGHLGAESARLQDIIDRMLELSSLEGRHSLENAVPLDLAEIAAGAVEDLAPLLAEQTLRIETPAAETPVSGERFLLRQAILNLVQNALDFSGPGAEVTVTVSRENGAAAVRVTDNGPGIPDYALGKVFDRFYSLPRPATGKKSSGLGLAFVREIAELHGGHAGIANRTAGGAEATLRLPCRTPGATAPP